MKLTLRSCVTTGAVLFSAYAIAVSPLVPTSAVSEVSELGPAGTDTQRDVHISATADATVASVPIEVHAPVTSSPAAAVAVPAPVAIPAEVPAVESVAATENVTTSLPAVDDEDPVHCAAIGCRPGEPGYPLGDGDPVHCAAIGCRPGEPGYPLGDEEPVYCAAIGCRPGEPGYPLGGAEPGEQELVESDEDLDPLSDAVRPPNARASAGLSNGNGTPDNDAGDGSANASGGDSATTVGSDSAGVDGVAGPAGPN